MKFITSAEVLTSGLRVSASLLSTELKLNRARLDYVGVSGFGMFLLDCPTFTHLVDQVKKIASMTYHGFDVIKEAKAVRDRHKNAYGYRYPLIGAPAQEISDPPPDLFDDPIDPEDPAGDDETYCVTMKDRKAACPEYSSHAM